ncbi:MAG: DUF4837 family protein [Gemmatimonadota bacterium]
MLAAGGVAACDDPQAYGQANSLILRAPDSLWAQLEDTTYAALERTIRTVREEHQFRVTHVSPGSDDWQDLRRFHQVVIFGTPDDPMMQRVLEAAGRPDAEPPAVVQAQDMWARGQLVTGVLLEPGNEAETWKAQLDEIHRSIDQQYRDYVFRRMYVSGVDTTLMDSLRAEYGFTVRVPNVYTVQRFPEENMVIFRNDNPDPSELIRSLTVAWRPRLDSLVPDTAFAWRSRIDTTYYNVPQLLHRDTATRPRRFTHNQQRPALEVQGTWEDQSDFPAAGPFVARLIQCPERTFFLDAWLYAPGKDKYQYMLQLQRLMDSFRCTREPGGGG